MEGIYLYPNAQLCSRSWARAIRVKRNTFQQTKWEKWKRLVHVLLAHQNGIVLQKQLYSDFEIPPVKLEKRNLLLFLVEKPNFYKNGERFFISCRWQQALSISTSGFGFTPSLTF